MPNIRAISVEVQPHYSKTHSHAVASVRLKVEVFNQEPLYLQRDLRCDDFESLFSYLLRELKTETLNYVRGGEAS